MYYKKQSEFDLLGSIIVPLYGGFRQEIVSSISNVYFLPASRSGLYQALSTFSAVIAELSKSRNFLTHKIELPNISEPVSDYFLYLSNISNQSSSKYKNIIEEIEKNILRGKVLFNKDNRKIVFLLRILTLNSTCHSLHQ